MVENEGIVGEVGRFENCCDSAASMDGNSLCDFFVLNLKGDLGDVGDFGVSGDRGLSAR
jgi:hypothetical protein